MELLKLKKPRQKPKPKVAKKASVSFKSILAIDAILKTMPEHETSDLGKEIRFISATIRRKQRG